jgi:hypothetical protein
MDFFAAFDKDGPVFRKWNSPWFGVPLWSVSACVCLLWYFHTPSPGKAIGALAVVAGIMSVREMKVLGKILWVALLVFLLVTEFHAIDKDRAENEESQRKFFEAQQQGFEQTAQQAAQNFAATTKSLTTSITGLDTVLRTTQQVANLSKVNLLSITGGSSFPFIIPDIAIVSGNPLPKSFTLTLKNAGKYPLTGLSVAIAHVTAESSNGSLVRTDSGLSRPHDAGSLRGHATKLVPNYFMSPLHDDPSSHPHYVIEIDAQNGTVREDLWLRPSTNGLAWAYKFAVFRDPGTGKPLIEQDWVEPLMLH